MRRTLIFAVGISALALTACGDDPSARTPAPGQAKPSPADATPIATQSVNPGPIGGRIEPSRGEPDRIDGRIESGSLRQTTVDPRAPLSQGAGEPDRRLAASIESAIDRATGLSDVARDIEVTAIHGRVTLRGLITDAAELDRVRRIASDIAGADRVNLDVSIRPR